VVVVAHREPVVAIGDRVVEVVADAEVRHAPV
jgi:ATP-binding cassette subfamily C protein CydD